MTSDEIILKAEKLYNEGIRKFKVDLGYSIEIRRVAMSRNGLMLMLPKSKKYGVLLKNINVANIEPVINKVSIEEQHKKQLLKAIKLLESSGLWQDNLRDMKIALNIGYTRLKQAYDITQEKIVADYYENQKLTTQKLKSFEPSLINVVDGKEHPNTNILWYLTNPLKIKKMNFGESYCLDTIKKAMENKEPCHTSGRTSYDVSFEYSPEKNRAWYSEEFKGCGNGHYYLALNHEYAVHYEDD